MPTTASSTRSVGLGALARHWLYDAAAITPAMIVAHVWQTTGLVMLLLGLAALPTDPIEAATVEGASPWQTFRMIVVPMLLPTIVVVTIISVIAGFTTFDLVWVMGRDYPNRSTLTLAVHQYWESFRSSRWAYGAAVAVILGVIALLITGIQAWLTSDESKRSVMNSLMVFQGNYAGTTPNLVVTATVLASLPTLAFFFVLRRYLMEGPSLQTA